MTDTGEINRITIKNDKTDVIVIRWISLTILFPIPSNYQMVAILLFACFLWNCQPLLPDQSKIFKRESFKLAPLKFVIHSSDLLLIECVILHIQTQHLYAFSLYKLVQKSLKWKFVFWGKKVGSNHVYLITTLTLGT